MICFKEFLMKSSSTILFAVACALVIAPGCAAPKGETPEAKREYALAMKDRALEQVYAKKPEAKQDVESAPGYMVVDGLAWGFGFLGSGGGYGVAVDNATKQVTYMRHWHFMPGFGIAGKGYKEIVVFENAETFKKFTTGKWDTGGNAEAAFNFGETGGSALASGSFDKKVKVYEVTNDGIVLRASIPITNYTRDKKLNAAPAPGVASR
jgi:hypothetical protein